ncbi:MAG: tRNA (N6-threonylcarbamoyladenosine(37)-N6)-methyltransferase TrmO [Candidatus Methanomethylicia archaeon]|nr:tRNA (N6-threonylcarbamoyladenosine(37)-N6)-methyltransferase TrmO [Candidatus Methanomethylicia archaeon]
MKPLEVLFFKTSTCDECAVVGRIFSSVTEKVNGYYGATVIDLKTYDLEDQEGYKRARELGISTTPTIVIHGEKYKGKISDDEIFSAIAGKMNVTGAELESLKAHVLKYEIEDDGQVFSLRPIGRVRVEYDDEAVKESVNGVSGTVEIFDQFADGLEGLEGFSHLTLVAYLSKVSENQRRILKVKPKWLIKLGADPEKVPSVGVFGTHSPHRPNPIGITVVKLVRRDGNLLQVEGLDLFDGTPVIDIKPFIKEHEAEETKTPAWYTEMIERAKSKYGNDF